MIGHFFKVPYRFSAAIMKKIFVFFTFVTLFSASLYGAEKTNKQELVFFYSLSCDKCIRIKDFIMPQIEKQFEGSIDIVYKDIADIENYKELLELKKTYSKDEKVSFPVLFLSGNFIDERDLKGDEAEAKISNFVSSIDRRKAHGEAAKSITPLDHFMSFTLPAVAAAGLIDGINPCSFTVMVFFISFLSLQGYNRKTILVSGCAFILASFLTYILIGLGLFAPLHALKGYSSFTLAINVAVGSLSIGLGIISIYDAIIFLKTKRPEDSILKLPVRIKNRIHRLVGAGFRKKDGGELPLSFDRGVFKLFMASLAIGFSISVFESVCTGQLYLPTIIFVLKTAPHKLQALYYLLTYNVMFIVPLAGVFLLAIAGVSSQGFAGIFKRYFLIIKILLALLFLGLGATIVFAGEDKPISFAPKPDRSNDDFYWNFGRVKEGAMLKHRFFIRNNTEKPFRIKQVNTSCACTVSTIEKDIVLPRQKIPIYIEFKTEGYPGEKTRYTYVHTDSDKVGIIVFEIKAHIVEKSQKKEE